MHTTHVCRGATGEVMQAGRHPGGLRWTTGRHAASAGDVRCSLGERADGRHPSQRRIARCADGRGERRTARPGPGEPRGSNGRRGNRPKRRRAGHRKRRPPDSPSMAHGDSPSMAHGDSPAGSRPPCAKKGFAGPVREAGIRRPLCAKQGFAGRHARQEPAGCGGVSWRLRCVRAWRSGRRASAHCGVFAGGPGSPCGACSTSSA